jgi:DHA1 family bicyclomycin/chloramphenicol resistance-like MFS transporter
MSRVHQTKGTLPATILIILAGLLAMVPVGMDMYLPALPEIATHFQASTRDTTLNVALFFIGNTLGQFIGGPLSDKIGRKSVAIFGAGLFIVCAALILFVPSMMYMQSLRCIQGIAAGFGAVIVFPTLRDLYTGSELGSKIAAVMILVMSFQLLAPFIGATLLQISWKLIFILMIALLLLLITCYVWRLPETSPRMARLSVRQFFSNYYMILSARHAGYHLAIRYLGMMAMTMAVNLSFVASAVFVYREYFGVNAFSFSLLFALSILCMALCTNYSRMRMRNGHSSFKDLSLGMRVHLLAVLSFFLVCLLIQPTLWLVVPLLVSISGFVGLIMPHCMSLYLNLHDELAGSAMSCSTACNFLCGGLSGILIAYWHDGSLLPIAMCMLSASLLGNLLCMTAPPGPIHDRSQ